MEPASHSIRSFGIMDSPPSASSSPCKSRIGRMVTSMGPATSTCVRPGEDRAPAIFDVRDRLIENAPFEILLHQKIVVDVIRRLPARRLLEGRHGDAFLGAQVLHWIVRQASTGPGESAAAADALRTCSGPNDDQ